MEAPHYTLHYAPDNASLVVRLALEELAVPYATCLVDRRNEAQKTAEYRALNPNGLIPVLETTYGPLFETGAILLWLADNHGSLGPASDKAERGDFLKWLFFLSNTIHPALRRLFYAAYYIGDDPQDQAILRYQTQQNIAKHLTLLEERWKNAPAPALALNFYLMPMMRWLVLYPTDIDRTWFNLADYPELFRTATRLEKRECVVTVSLLEGLGPKPFTEPQPPNPPEGSAT